MAAGYIAVVDYHKGNLLSVERGLATAGAEVRVTDDPEVISGAAGIVVPGVGAFDDAMAYMDASGQSAAICAAVREGTPLLGICLGMQLLFARGNEHAVPPAPGETPAWVPGLGILDGEVTRLEGGAVKVPHVGWNAADFEGRVGDCPLVAGIDDATYFYFTHSYACRPANRDCVVATTEHGGRFASIVWDGGVVFGAQFHPEKSSAAGHRMLANFVSVVQGA